MRSTSILLLATLSSLAASTPVSFTKPISFINDHLIPKHVRTPKPSSCDLSAAVPPAATTPLPAISSGLSVYHIAIGRGTQNYTCADSTAASIPAAIGAVATLYNASCIAASNPTQLSSIPDMLLKVDMSELDGAIPDSFTQSGVHYFSNKTTPTFDLRQYGFTNSKKVASVPAPASKIPAVAWLKLAYDTSGEVGSVREIYRLNTAGGTPPATCLGMPAAFEVQYSAEYWFYSA
ncbi:hypothetical protein MMC30_004297 [Trapelia coarctata]|nr:hypothetical protein [Trapelia coarctata]